MKYKIKEIEFGDTTYVFVTRGNAKEFSDKEIVNYLTANSEEYDRISSLFEKEDAKIQEVWTIDETNVNQYNVFRSDLKMGAEFCAAKYGKKVEDIQREARRLRLGGLLNG